ALARAARQRRAAVEQQGLVAHRHGHDVVVDRGQAPSLGDRLQRQRRVGDGDVLANAVGEEERLLRHDAHRAHSTSTSRCCSATPPTTCRTASSAIRSRRGRDVTVALFWVAIALYALARAVYLASLLGLPDRYARHARLVLGLAFIAHIRWNSCAHREFKARSRMGAKWGPTAIRASRDPAQLLAWLARTAAYVVLT